MATATVLTGREKRPGDSFAEFVVREHGRAMLAYAVELLGDRAAAEDAVQEAMLRAWRRRDDLTVGRGSLRGWLLTVVRNIVLDLHRARRSRPREVSGVVGADVVAHDHADHVVASVLVDEVLSRLSPDHRAVLELVYLRDGSVRDAAMALGIPPGTVKSRSHYALQTLRAVSGIA
ncbi:RNA polymerase sigma-70 factor (ECF subfamily) [Actinoplanes lutulentus]|uniref:RNA polymerase sigma-70 factor (ECF subfamily) n=1 Tax=Actinoplanes lutulentus TaxID=1287878 RepID=A0A327ZJ95_9ACTN|nr:sigma-70 family RNA polymerase sigma factor [Actinoplanes lutulentus]MBB2940591.1 RNA polymerase sigma-70 factor (ECF subfamily) [Actinoplanes lutulentus]RAK42902.1 RNA polymerase sigma-70 factor (ECF subfamily) [Actinoplanes lutulentus]